MSAYENYAKVKASIEEKRQRAIARADARNAEVRGRSSVIAEIDRELEGTGLKIFSAACRGEDIEPIRLRNTELMEARKEELKKLGYPEDYTEVHYFCKKCSDTGFIDGLKICECFKEALKTENIKSSGIGALIETQTFENFSAEIYKNEPEVYERTLKNLNWAKQYAKTFAKTGQNAFFYGTTGTGKTHISTAIAREAIMQGYTVVYDSVQNVISDFEADRFRSNYGANEPKSTKYLDCDLLILDDLGSEFVTQFSISCLSNLINSRQNKKLATLISTNLLLEEISERYEDRIVSRILSKGSLILEFLGSDQRVIS